MPLTGITKQPARIGLEEKEEQEKGGFRLGE